MSSTATIDVTTDNVARYRQPRCLPVFPAERRLIDRLLRPGMRVLDLGCGSGRIFQYLLQHGARVLGCDLSDTALRDLRQNLRAHSGVAISRCDARRLPFTDGFFQAVIFAFNGIDCIYPEADRLVALREVDRVLVPGGYFIFSSHNPLGTLLSPRGFRSWRAWRWRGKYLLSGAWRKVYFRDHNGILGYQATPRTVIEQVGTHTRMRFRFAVSRSGIVTSRALLSIVSAWPYYVFMKIDEHREGSTC
jgi:SAM-dependent methyltransferase